jgi:hypothetical protein
MKTLFTILLATLCAVTGYGQTIKSLGFTTNGQVVANTGTNALKFTNTSVGFGNNGTFITPTSISNNAGGVNVEELYLFYDGQEKLRWGGQDIEVTAPLSFNGTNAAKDTLANLLPAYSNNASKVLALNSTATDVQWVTMTAGTNTNSNTNAVSFPILISQGGSGATTASGARNNLSLGAAWLTNTSAATFRSDIGLGATWLTNTNVTNFRSAIGLGATWLTNTNANSFREAVGLGAANNVTFSAIGVGGEIDITGPAIIGTSWNQTFNFEERKFEVDGGNLLEWGEENGPLKVGRALSFPSSSNAAATRANLTLGATWLTNTNVTNFRTAIGLGATNAVTFGNITASGLETDSIGVRSTVVEFYKPIWIGDSGTNNVFAFELGEADQAKARTNLGLGATNIVTFAGLTNNGDITINSTTASNGLLFIRRTNNEPFLGLANLLASNNTTISNETLFRVGVSEATNRSAQFGFRSTNTNGSGVAVFSVFGFDALMMIGADASTNAVIYSGGGTNNEVMTLIRDGATEFARPIRFSTNASTRPATNAPANTTNVAAWVEIRIGTNSYRAPLYQ